MIWMASMISDEKLNAMSSAEQHRLECEARYWIVQAHKQDKAWRYWLRQKLAHIEEVRKHPQPELRAEINRQVGKNGG